MCEITTDLLMKEQIIDELREENARLLTNLCFESNLNQILENFRNYSLVLINSCKCETISDIKRDIKQFNDIYIELKSTQTLLIDKQMRGQSRDHQSSAIVKSNQQKRKRLNGLVANERRISSANEKPFLSASGHSADHSDSGSQFEHSVDNRSDAFDNEMTVHSNQSLILDLIQENSERSVDLDLNSDHFLAINGSEVFEDNSNSMDFCCNECEKLFQSESALVIHLNTVHKEGDCPLVCHHCQRTLQSSDEYLRHLATKHSIAAFECGFCPFKTYTKQRILKHQRVHSTDTPFQCDIEGCGEAFRTQYYLTNHRIQSHSKDRRFECTYCHYKSDKKWNLDSHMSTHSVEKHFRCLFDGCGKQFASKIRLYEHRVNTHSDKRFACDWQHCMKVFRHKKTLNKHKRTAHSLN